METIIWNFPHIAGQIFEKLDDKSLKICTEVSTVWRDFIENEKFYWSRVTKIDSGNIGFGWDEIMASVQDSKTFCSLGKVLYKMQSLKIETGFYHPIHPITCAVYLDNVELFETILTFGPDLQSLMNTNEFASSPLHLAASFGSVKVIGRILDKLDNDHKVWFIKTCIFHIMAKIFV